MDSTIRQHGQRKNKPEVNTNFWPMTRFLWFGTGTWAWQHFAKSRRIWRKIARNVSVMNFSNEANQGCRLFSAKRKSENVCLNNLKCSGEQQCISSVLRSKMHDDTIPRITLLFILSCLARIHRVDVPNIIINMHHGSVSLQASHWSMWQPSALWLADTFLTLVISVHPKSFTPSLETHEWQKPSQVLGP